MSKPSTDISKFWPYFTNCSYGKQTPNPFSTQLAGAVEYTNFISAEGIKPLLKKCPGYETKPSDAEDPILELWEI